MTSVRESALLRRVEWYGWGVTGVLTLGGLVFGYPLVASGCAIGGALSVLHFKWLALFLSAVVDPRKRQRYGRVKKIVFGAYVAKYLIIGGVVYLLLRYRLVDPVGFLGGLSAIFVAICLAGIHPSPSLIDRQD
jgi:hypothetical protein